MGTLSSIGFIVGMLIVGFCLIGAAFIVSGAITGAAAASKESAPQSLQQPTLSFLTEYDAADYIGISLNELDYMRGEGMLDDTFIAVTSLEQNGEEEYRENVDGVEVTKTRPSTAPVTRFLFNRQLLDERLLELIKEGQNVNPSRRSGYKQNKQKNSAQKNSAQKNERNDKNVQKPQKNSSSRPEQEKHSNQQRGNQERREHDSDNQNRTQNQPSKKNNGRGNGQNGQKQRDGKPGQNNAQYKKSFDDDGFGKTTADDEAALLSRTAASDSFGADVNDSMNQHINKSFIDDDGFGRQSKEIDEGFDKTVKSAAAIIYDDDDDALIDINSFDKK